jgi:phosphoribosylanthranilate isomerase
MTPYVKICGITREEDARLAVRLGAQAIGFVLWPASPRAIAVQEARRIAMGLDASVWRAGVFVNAQPADVRRVVQTIGLDVVQLHGDERVADFMECGATIVKAVALRDVASLEAAEALPRAVTLLVDAADPVRRGGTGLRANWALAARLAGQRPIILAGGLTAENVEEAIARVHPAGVDVSSGVEARPGIKDPVRLEQFFAAVASARASEVSR